MTLDALNTAKSCFASIRPTANTVINCFNAGIVAGYLTSAISEETYTAVLLSGMLGSMAYNLADASISYAAKGVSSITDGDAAKLAAQNIEAIKANIAFQSNPCLETGFALAGLPDKEKITNPWEAASLAGKVVAQLAKMSQARFLYNAFGRYYLLLYIFEQVLEGTIREIGKAEEVNRDAETMNRWLAVLKAMPPEETDHPLQKELEAKFGSTLNRMLALNPQIGIQYATAFQELMSEKSLPKNEAAL